MTNEAIQDPENFAVQLTDGCGTHGEWLAIVRFGLQTLLDNPPLFMEVICREADRQLQRKNFPSLTIADEARFIFEELKLKLVVQ